MPSEFFKLVVIEFKLTTKSFKFEVIFLRSFDDIESEIDLMLLLASLKSEIAYDKFSELFEIKLEISSDVSDKLLVKLEKSWTLDFSSCLVSSSNKLLILPSTISAFFITASI